MAPLTLDTLQPARGSRRTSKRRGRGNASGRGTYSGRGQKGQLARSGGRNGLKIRGVRRFIQQTPKKRGFHHARNPLPVVNLSTLERMSALTTVTPATLLASKVIRVARFGVKILGDGTITRALTVRGCSVSASAKEKIIAAGGTIGR